MSRTTTTRPQKTTYFRKIIATMTLAQKAITAAALTFALVCALAVMTLALETLSGRLDHIYNPDFCGSVVVDELPERLAPESISLPFNLYLPSDPSSLSLHRLSFTYDELNDWLGKPCPSANYPMSIVVDLSEQYSVGFNVLETRHELIPMGTGDFYVVLSRSVVNEMCQLLKGTDEVYTFEVELNPINFNSAELALRGVLYALWKQYNRPAEVVVLLSCIILGFLGFTVIRLWKKKIYCLVRYDVILFEEGENDYFGHWD